MVGSAVERPAANSLFIAFISESVVLLLAEKFVLISLVFVAVPSTIWLSSLLFCLEIAAFEVLDAVSSLAMDRCAVAVAVDAVDLVALASFRP